MQEKLLVIGFEPILKKKQILSLSCLPIPPLSQPGYQSIALEPCCVRKLFAF